MFDRKSARKDDMTTDVAKKHTKGYSLTGISHMTAR